MPKHTTITLQIIRLMTIVVIVTIAFVSIISYTARSYITEKELEEEKELIFLKINDELKLKKDVGILSVVELVHNHELQIALKNNDRKGVYKIISSLAQAFKTNTNYKGMKIHVTTPDLHSFARSWNPEKFGDDLSMLQNYVAVAQSKKAQASWAVQHSGFVLAAIAPIITPDGEFLGLINLSQGVGSVSREFENEGVNYIQLIDSSIAQRHPVLSKMEKVGYFVVSNDEWFSSGVKKFAHQLNFNALFEKGYLLDATFFTVSVPVLDVNNQRVGYHILGIQKSKVEDQINQALAINTYYIWLIVAIFFWIAIFIFIGLKRLVVTPLRSLEKNLAITAQTKDLSTPLIVDTTNEVARICDALNNLLFSFSSSLKEVQQSSYENVALSQQLSNTSKLIEENVLKESSLLKDVSSKGATMQTQLEESLAMMEETQQQISHTHETLSSSQSKLSFLVGNIEQTAQKEIELSQRLIQLSGQTNDVRNILGVIDDIANQTNLLALNAAIEAARAGEHGRGFAVVADEVRKLAERTQKSLGEINVTINVIVQAISNSADDMEQNAQSMENLVEDSKEVQGAIDMLSQMMQGTKNTNQSLSHMSHSNTKQTQIILESITSIASLSSQNARSVEEISQSANFLYEKSESLETTIESFKI